MYRTGQGWKGESQQVKIRTVLVDVALGILSVVVPLFVFPTLSVSLEGDTFFIHILLTVIFLAPSLFCIFSFCFLHADQQVHKATHTSLWHGMCGLIFGTLFFHLLAILFGAPFVDLFARTFMWSLLMATLVTIPQACIVNITKIKVIRKLLVFKFDRLHTTRELSASMGGLGAMLGGWMGAIPIPLDWDRDWQQWPVSCCYGALLGFAAFLFMASILIVIDILGIGTSQKND